MGSPPPPPQQKQLSPLLPALRLPPPQQQTAPYTIPRYKIVEKPRQICHTPQESPSLLLCRTAPLPQEKKHHRGEDATGVTNQHHHQVSNDSFCGGGGGAVGPQNTPISAVASVSMSDRHLLDSHFDDTTPNPEDSSFLDFLHSPSASALMPATTFDSPSSPQTFADQVLNDCGTNNSGTILPSFDSIFRKTSSTPSGALLEVTTTTPTTSAESLPRGSGDGAFTRSCRRYR